PGAQDSSRDTHTFTRSIPMRTIIPSVLAFTLAGAATITPVDAHAQGASADASRPATMSALLSDIARVEEKLVSLGEAIPEDRYGWRPADGVRSVSEVMIHIAADNWFLPTAAGVAAPE